MLKRFFCLVLLLTASFFSCFAQTPTTQGTEFWLSFMRNGYRTYNSTNHLYLIASAKRTCTVTVSSPHTQWTQSNVVGNGITTIIIPDAEGYNDQQSGIANKGLYVTATDTISLYIANETQNSYDAANVLPIQALGCKYMVQTNKSLYYQNGSHADDNRASFMIVATEDNTQVQITPSCQTMDNHSETYSVTLQRGQCYHVLNKNPGYANNTEGDFSGTWIESLDNKPIAVFNGNSVTAVADAAVNEGYDHVFEQAMPADNWGKKFVVTKTRASQTLQNDRVKVTALLDNTDVWRNGELLYQGLSAGESRAFWLTETSCYLESSGPVAVYLYNHSHSSSNTYGDPSMVWISPVEQNLQDVIFSTFTSQTQLDHFVNVVCYTDDVSELLLNGDPIPPNEISTVSGAPQFSFARVTAELGMNRLQCPGGLVAHVYGMGDRQGYAYTVGSSAKKLTKQLYVDDILSTELTDGYHICQGETVSFRVETNYEFDHVAWDFGDGASGEGAEVSHEFSAAGDPVVEAVVYKEMERSVQPFDTLNVTLHVHPKKEFHHDPFFTCLSTYSFDGQDYPVPGTYEIHYETTFGCDSVVFIYLEQANSVHTYLDPVVTCESTYQFDGQAYDVPGDYEVHYAIAQECDSIVHIHLEQGSDLHTYLDPVVTCESTYQFDGQAYDVPGDYEVHYELAMGCDSIVHIHLEEGSDVHANLEPVLTCEPTYQFDADHVFAVPGDYEVHYELAMGCDSIVHIHLEEDVPYFRDSTISTCGDIFQYDADHVFSVPGDHEVHFSTIHGCDSVIYLHLEQKDAIVRHLEHVACESYTWYGVSYTDTNHHIEHLVPDASPEGCDSLYIMDLTIVPNGDQYYEKDTCDVYHWMGQDYDESGVYTITVLGDYGCESHLQLSLQLHRSPPFERILGRDVMTIASNFWPGEYVYFLDDSTGMNLENIHWELLDNPGWIIEPDGASCVIIANARGTGVLHVWTTGESFCDEKEAFKTISCGGYAVEEQEPVAVEIYPNPATDELFVKGEDVERVLIYNVVGQKIKEVEAHGDVVTRISLSGLTPTLYLVEVQTRKGNKT